MDFLLWKLTLLTKPLLWKDLFTYGTSILETPFTYETSILETPEFLFQNHPKLSRIILVLERM